ncbi:MAG: hypothetical protein ACI8X5_004045 [Planctomycetota bacterium]|jgi:hypothetical protein
MCKAKGIGNTDSLRFVLLGKTQPAGPSGMKLRIAIGAVIWLLVMTLGHLQLNVGFDKLAKNFRVYMGSERPELVVGFLPVT